MKLRSLLLILLLSFLVQAVRSQQATAPLAKSQVMDLVKAGMDGDALAKRIAERGIDFELSQDDVQALQTAGAGAAVIKALRAAKPKPLSKDQVLKLAAGGLPVAHAADLVKQRGIDFMADEKFLDTLRVAGAGEAMVAAVRQASSAATAELILRTSPDAEVLLDEESQGHASARGELTIKCKPGAHTLKVSLPGTGGLKKDIMLPGGQSTQIEARVARPPNPRGITKQQIIDLLRSDVASSRIVPLVKERGIKFSPTEADLNEIRSAGGTEELIQALREPE